MVQSLQMSASGRNGNSAVSQTLSMYAAGPSVSRTGNAHSSSGVCLAERINQASTASGTTMLTAVHI